MSLLEPVRQFVLRQRQVNESPDALTVIHAYRYSAGEEAFPCLPLLACRLYGGRDDLALPLTGAFYLGNLASEVLDDQMDGEQDKAWSQWDGSRATLAAVDLLMLAQLCLAQTLVPVEILREVFIRFTEAVLTTSRGQRKSVQPVRSIEAYWSQAVEKSGACFAFGMWSGAKIAGASTAELDVVARFGAKLGVLSQVMDDVIDFVSPTAHTRVDPFEFDSALPVVLALAQDHPGSAALARELDKPHEGRTVLWHQDTRQRVLDLHGLALALKIGAQYESDLLSALNRWPPEQCVELREHILTLTATLRRMDALMADKDGTE